MMPDWQKDYEAGRKILQSYDLPVFECPLHLEGGSIHSDGQGWVAPAAQPVTHMCAARRWVLYSCTVLLFEP
jgi:agmatine deiminase